MSFSFLPRTVYKTRSKISGEIEVKEQFGRYTLHVGNMIQSGGMLKGIWGKALKSLRVQKFQGSKVSRFKDLKVQRFKSVLVLGLGGGTVVQLIKAQYSEAKIVGIEIDSEIIKIGKKFFGLNEIENLKIINTDAIDWCLNDSNHLNRKFDLILVDLYIGGDFPKKAMSDEFLRKIKKLLSKEGIVIFNWLKNKSEKELENKLKESFFNIKKFDTRTNLFFFVN